MTIAEIKDFLQQNAGHNTKFSEMIIPGADPIMGVRLPVLRVLAKKIAKDDYKSFLRDNPMDNFEMQTLQGMVLGYAKDDIYVLLDYAREFIPKIHDWSVNDSFCQTFKIARKYPREVFDFLMEYKESQNEYEIRVVTVMLLSHFLTDDYVDDVIDVINSLCTDTYYAMMGVAWTVATIMAKYPDKCISYMVSDRNALDDITYNKAISKMKESYRVSDENKRYMETLIRKER